MKIVLLDIGNVLVNVDFSRFNLHLEDKVLGNDLAVVEQYCNGKYKQQLDRGLITPRAFFKQLACDLQAEEFEWESICRYWSDIFSEIPGSVESVAKLQNNYNVWIASDTDPVHFNFLLNHFPVLKQASRFYLSYISGSMKNSPEFFQWILNQHDLVADQFILIDDKEENCRSAELCGMSSILFEDWESTLDDF